ncbi:hypothetical protein G7051_03145 [Dysgonomonas sp. HDW5B]|uniref:hypothetical protein n=1 Tax=Dysgonomonas sp. HDW5B TaxID=2714927 RepID=UPI00140A71EC|nr:hypothetical protein [Dysgonomonas sp. HDW5B]QIK53396.1 hypothetical protein G7051_03145 [Dysgonomonas sp. HDW5B]
MRKGLITVLLLFVGLAIIAQGQQDKDVTLPQVTPLSPNAAALGRFGSYPIGHYTGTVGISVDLYQFQLNKDIALNVSLDYHSGGIKIDDTPSSVGTGWALSAGGCITREIKGGRDENPNGFFNYSKQNKGHKPIVMDDITDKLVLQNLSYKSPDTEPDIFTFNVNGKTVKFFCDNYGDFRTIPYSDLKVIVSPLKNRNAIGTWEIADENGIRYIFKEGEMSETVNGHLYCDTWWLSDIKSPEGITLASFEYSAKSGDTSPLKYRYHVFMMSSSFYPKDHPLTQLLGEKTSESYVTKDVYKILSKITIPGQGYLSFERYSDIKTEKQIKTIKFYDNKGNFNYEYNLTYSDTDRLFLTQIIKSTPEEQIKYREFKYHKENLLPGRGSVYQDKWGYYNPNVSSLYLYIPDLPESVIDYPFIATNNRIASKEAKYGSIERIIYPTGGYTVFDFDNNRVVANDSIIYENLVNKSLKLSTYGKIEQEVSIAKYSRFIVKAKLAYHTTGLYKTTLKLVDSNGKTVSTWLADGNTTAEYEHNKELSILIYSYDDSTLKKPLYLTSGKYKLILEMGDEGPVAPGAPKTPYPAEVLYTYTEPVKSFVAEKSVGGLRINNIYNYDSKGSLLESVSYIYEKDSKSTGVESPEPKFVRDFSIRDCNPEMLLLADWMHCREFYQQPISPDVGYPIQYWYVREERKNGNNEVLRTDYEYSTRSFQRDPQLLNKPHFVNISTPYSINDYQGGLLKSKIDYKYESGKFYEIKKEINEYTIKTQGVPSYKSLNINNVYITNLCDGNQEKYDLYSWGYYNVTSAKVFLNKKTITQTLGNNTNISQSNFAYTNPNYQQVTSQEQIDSKGKILRTTYEYCFDQQSAIYDSMVVRNIIAYPIQITKVVDNKQIEKRVFNFDFFNTNKIIELSSALKQTSKDATFSNITYLNYDSYGNPLYITKDDATKIVYLWSYNGQHPIAEINIMSYTYAEIENIVKSVFSVTSIDALSKQAIPTEAKLKDGSLQNAFPNALVTTYTYKPLVGVLTMTDPRGVTTYYDYDAFGRLKETYIIENGVKKIIQVNEYHYQNQ